MDKAKRDLKTISGFIIFLDILNLVSTLLMVFGPNGTYTAEALMLNEGYSLDKANFIVGVIVFVGVVAFLLQFYVGLKGIIIANGGKRSKLATGIVVISIILIVIGCVSSIINIVSGNTNILGSQIIIQVCELMNFTLFIVYSNKVISLRKTNV